MNLAISAIKPNTWQYQLNTLRSGVNKIFETVKEIFKSPTFYLASFSILAIASIAVPLSLASPIALLIPAFFTITNVSIFFKFKKEIFYETNLWVRLLEHNLIPSKKFKWFHKITDNLYLGGLPLKNKNHLEKLKAKKVFSILSVIEDFEYRNTPISFPVSKNELKNEGFLQHQIVTKDFHPVDLKDIIDSVAFIKRETNKGNKVLVHCKSGVGRSATIVCCYLLEKYNLTPEKAVEFVKGRRLIITIKANSSNLQFRQIQKYYEYLQRKRSFY